MKRLYGVVLAAMMVVACLAATGCAPNEGSTDNAITVSASASVESAPDTANIDVLAEGAGPTEHDAFKSAEQVVDGVLGRLRDEGVKDENLHADVADAVLVQVESGEPAQPASTEPEMVGYFDDFGNWVEEPLSDELVDDDGNALEYRITTTIHVDNVPADRVNALLNATAEAGASGFGDYTCWIAQYDGIYQQSLTAAVDAAYDKAKVVADAGGVFVGRVLNVVEDTQADSLELSKQGKVSDLDVSGEGGLMFDMGMIPVEARVTVSYEIS